MMIRAIYSLLVLLLPAIIFANDLRSKEAVAQEVLQKLYVANGNFSLTRPELFLVGGRREPASYNTFTQRIYLEETTYDLCRSLGRDSLNALAFILGHELAHNFQEEIKRQKVILNFVAYDRNPGSNIELEKRADILGALTAYLAGYEIRSVLPKLLTKVYSTYGLEEENPGYPPLAERQLVTREVFAVVEELIDLFEGANYLSAAGQYTFAAAAYEYILRHYAGREIYNNLGVCYTIAAMHVGDKDVDWFLYPLELDWDTRIKKPKLDRGTKMEDPALIRQRKTYLLLARQYFEKALEADPNYLEAEINRLCVASLLDQERAFIEHTYHQLLTNIDRSSYPQSYRKKAQLAYALAMVRRRASEEQARQIWQTLQADADPLIAYQAGFNLQILEEGKCSAGKDYGCIRPIALPERVDGVLLHRQLHRDFKELTAAIGLYREKLPNSRLLVFLDREENRVLALQLIPIGSSESIAFPKINSGDSPLQLIAVQDGQLIVCRTERVIFKTREQHLEEYVRYQLNE